jgi:LPXTG-motif cell wall-anchored protein
VVDDATITAVTPAGTGTVDVTVVGSPACADGTLPAAFAYQPGGGGSGTGGGAGTGTAGTGAGTGTLASTGSSWTGAPLLGGAALLLLVGAGLVTLRRWRRAL